MIKDYLYPTVKTPMYLKMTDEIDTKISQYGLGYYYTFLAQEASETLREWLHKRKEDIGRELKDEDYIFTNRRRTVI